MIDRIEEKSMGCWVDRGDHVGENCGAGSDTERPVLHGGKWELWLLDLKNSWLSDSSF